MGGAAQNIFDFKALLPWWWVTDSPKISETYNNDHRLNAPKIPVF